MLGSAPRPVLGSAPCSLLGSASGSLAQLQDRLPDADLGAELDGGGLGDAAVADVGAVGGAEVLDVPLVTGAGDACVAGGDVVVVETDRGVVTPADEQRGLLE